VSLKVLVPLAGQIVSSADHTEHLVLDYLGVAEEVGLLVVEVEIVVVSRMEKGLTRGHCIARIPHDSACRKVKRLRRRASVVYRLRVYLRIAGDVSRRNQLLSWLWRSHGRPNVAVGLRGEGVDDLLLQWLLEGGLQVSSWWRRHHDS